VQGIYKLELANTAQIS